MTLPNRLLSALIATVLLAGPAASQQQNKPPVGTPPTPTADALSVTEFGALGDGKADDTAAIQKALNAACEKSPSSAQLYLPAGHYRISKELQTHCAIFISGAGPTSTEIFDTVQETGRRTLSTDDSLWLQDLSINTAPLTVNKGMIAVARGFSRPGVTSHGQVFTFIRFNSSGYNFSLDINGQTDSDVFASMIVRDCKLQVSTQTNAVSAPINVANGASLIVQDSTLTGDRKNDHAIYALGVRDVLIENNHMSDIGNSAIKLLTGVYGAGAVCPVVSDDYAAWKILNNEIQNSVMAIAAYTYCDIKLPLLRIAGNTIRNMTDSYRSDYAAVYIQANCRSEMTDVTSEGNSFSDLGLGGLVLLSSIQRPKDGCGDANAMGTIRTFKSTSDTFSNWSNKAPGVFPAINASGSNLFDAAVSDLKTDGAGSDLGLSAFAHCLPCKAASLPHSDTLSSVPSGH